jgi:ketosteroid isomerase-like protein
MEEQQNTQLVKDAYAAYGRGDVAGVLSCMSPRIDWELASVPGLSFTGKRKGSDQVAEYFRLADEARTMREFVPKDFIAQGDKVVVLGSGAWTVRATGRDFASDWVHVFTVEDGHISAFREFLDSHLAVEAFQAGAPD